MMTKKEMLLAAELLELAAGQFASHGCNDMDDDMLARAGFTPEDHDSVSLA